ncbi:hypothetical protein M0812_12252 [Anaeramoeba flamelloides]|uniref:Stealth protein CR2 conserved region 2 domain-containing protein n=1 Tax=Anaeramoeba flamelloides TaxID=1746091 RepID=A0AAV7ZQ24_9EUKA|nr:hypothetical protein M0812_12252 [Anaeramoeba flamelloides]
MNFKISFIKLAIALVLALLIFRTLIFRNQSTQTPKNKLEKEKEEEEKERKNEIEIKEEEIEDEQEKKNEQQMKMKNYIKKTRRENHELHKEIAHIKKTRRSDKKQLKKDWAKFENSKIRRLEDDEEDVTFYTGIEIEKDEIEIQRKELLIQRTEFDLEKREKEKKKRKPEKEKKEEKDEVETKEEENETQKEQKEEQDLLQSTTKEIDKLQKELNKEKRNLQIKKEIIEDEGKIDMVYTWGGITKDLHKRNRYNYELQFSLRSVEKYLPWINKIYILINSDTTYPYWLKPQYKLSKIIIIDRCQLFENEEDCPTYNSFAAYSIAHRIPGLSNKYILMDDDFFFNQPVKEDYFFTKNGLPICYDTRKLQRTYWRTHGLYPLAKERGFPLWKYARYTHRPIVNRRDFILKFEEQYPSFLEFVQSHKARYKHLAEDVSMIYYEFYYQNNLMKKLPEKFSKFYQTSMKHKCLIKEEFREYTELLTTKDVICFNVNDDWSKDYQLYLEQRKVLWKFFSKLYPEVPDFERPNPDHKANT